MNSDVTMTNEEFVELIQKGIDVQENLNILYEQNKRYIYKIANPFMKYAEADDLLQEAYIGFQEAIYAYKPGDAKLTTYAVWKIRQHCMRYIENCSNTKRLPSATYNLIKKYKAFVQYYQNQCGTVPDDKAIMKELGLTPKKLEHIRKTIYEQHFISLSSKVSENEELSLEEILADEYDMETDVENKLFQVHERKVLDDAIKQLKEKEQVVVTSRYWDNVTQKQIADQMNISPSRISAIERKALKALKKNDRVQELLKEKYGYDSYGVYHMSVKCCKDNHTSQTEQIAIKRIMIDEKQKSLQLMELEKMFENMNEDIFKDISAI